ncbi:hypothetical protein [Nocardia sp. NPDC057272]|uniref:hypothetical protein n=1 Tax=Nocardia sp. NPDC057272 TaxID=3346079 RepID=UPI0036263A04
MDPTQSRRIGLYGTGRAATKLVSAIAASPHTLTTAIVFFDEQAGRDIGSLTGGPAVGVTATTDLEGAIRSGEFEVMAYAGLKGEVLYQAIDLCVDAGVDLVHACFVHPRVTFDLELYTRWHTRAEETGARVVGTGMLPGFWLDVLPALLSSALPSPVSIIGESRSDITLWGRGVLVDEMGLGTPATPDQPGPMSGVLHESAAMIADVLGLTGYETHVEGGFVIAEAATEVIGIEVSPGDRVGFDQAAVMVHDGRERVRIAWKGLPQGSFEGYERSMSVTAIGGDGSACTLKITPAPDPYPGTAARIVHAVGAFGSLPGGLHTPVQLGI